MFKCQVLQLLLQCLPSLWMIFAAFSLFISRSWCLSECTCIFNATWPFFWFTAFSSSGLNFRERSFSLSCSGERMYRVHACSKVCTVVDGDLRNANANCLWMQVCTKYAANAPLRRTP